MKTFTVFCKDPCDDSSTTWIAAVQAEDWQSAADKGLAQCANDWGLEHANDVHLLGVSAGDIEILHWEDR